MFSNVIGQDPPERANTAVMIIPLVGFVITWYNRASYETGALKILDHVLLA